MATDTSTSAADTADNSAEAQALEDLSLEQERHAFESKRKNVRAAAAAQRDGATKGTSGKASGTGSGYWPPTLDQALVMGVAVAVVVAMVWVSTLEAPPETRLFTVEELSAYNGTRGRPLYLSILGQVFDVSKGSQHYASGKGYSFFVGRDASRAFVTGDFEGDLTDDVSGLTNEQYASLQEWQRFYHKEYVYKGRLVGAFYNRYGNATAMIRKVQAGAQAAKTADEIRRESEARFPKCNMRWSNRDGGWVSCDGEDLRPRKIFIQLPGGKPAERCACMQGIGWSDVRQVYPNCAPEAHSCQVSPATP